MLDLAGSYAQRSTLRKDFVIKHRVNMSAEQNPDSIVNVTEVGSLFPSCRFVFAGESAEVDLRYLKKLS